MTRKSDSTDPAVNPLLEELERADAAKKPARTGPVARPVHVSVAPTARQRAGHFAAVLSVFGDLFKTGAGRATPLIVRLVVIAALLGGLAYGGLVLINWLDSSGEMHAELNAKLEPYKSHITGAANDMLHKANVRGGINFVSFSVPPVVTEMPATVNFIAYRDEDRLNVSLGSGAKAEGTVNLLRREVLVRAFNEGSVIDSRSVTLPPEAESGSEGPASP